jgi:RNA polymerase sigma-70 factor (ECF subfamily)
MGGLSLRLWAVGIPWRSSPSLAWLGIDPGWCYSPERQFSWVPATLADPQGGLSSGLRIHKVQRTELMEDKPGKAPVASAPPAGPFDERFEAERGDLAGLCRRLLDEPAAAEDAVSEVYLRASRALSSYDSQQPFRPWLRAIASNYCIDQLRRQRTERKLFSSADLSEEGLADASPDVLHCLTRNEDRREVLAAIDSLPTKYRLPLVLRFYRDLDYGAIAELLDVTRNQVGSLLFRAKLQLRNRLTEGIEGIEEITGGAASDSGRADPDPKPRRRRRIRRIASASQSRQSANR